MASYVLDTHALVFSLAAPAKLGRKAKRALRSVEEGESQAWIPAAVAAEVVLLRELGRIEFGLAQLKTATEETPKLKFLSLDFPQIDEFAALGTIRDPFDRLIVSAARTVGAKLISKEEGFAVQGLVEIVWS
ncbi:MAG TPA: PIN domain-containing protein [Vicinamibacteria bacterium]|nr:PIN domain-containing protein [Vicinamibacteria bacterium]